MKKNFKIFWLLSKASIKAYISSPLGVILFFLGKVMRFLLLFLFIIFIANSTKTFIVDFGHGVGTYAATCDEKDSGYIWVVQAQQSEPVE